MWIGGDAIMFGLMMLVFLMWSMDERAATSGRGWFEAARRASMASLVASYPKPGAAPGGAGPAGSAQAAPEPTWDGRGGIDDDEHLAAYNAFLARLNEAEPGNKK
jgi:hypothetical protein